MINSFNIAVQNPDTFSCGHSVICSLVTLPPDSDVLVVDDLDIEDEGGVSGDGSSFTTAVSNVRRARELRLLAFLELQDALIPALDHLADTDFETDWLAALVGGVEYLTIGESALIVDLDISALGYSGAFSLVELLHLH